MGDSDLPRNVKEAFDFSTDFVYDWEVAKIRYAAELDEVFLSPHAEDEAIKDNFDIDDCYHVLRFGRAKTKDLPFNDRGRAEGINFEGNTRGGRRLLVKVGWWRGLYEIVTAYERK